LSGISAASFSSSDSLSSAWINSSGGSTNSSPSSLRTSSESRLGLVQHVVVEVVFHDGRLRTRRRIKPTAGQLVFGIGMPSLAVNCASS
jgi:hypothetical protein